MCVCSFSIVIVMTSLNDSATPLRLYSHISGCEKMEVINTLLNTTYSLEDFQHSVSQTLGTQVRDS